MKSQDEGRERREDRRLRDARRHSRQQVSWPVVVDDGKRFIYTETVNISPYGAKVRLRERLDLGGQVSLRVCPPGRPPFDLQAIIWRLDPDGPALLFLGTHSKDFPFRAAPAEAMADAVESGRPRASETILLVDDDPASRVLARDVLESTGYTVLDAKQDPIKALQLAKEHAGPIHLLLTDIVMPLMNGRHLVERLAPLRPEMKVVFMSAYQVSGVPRGAGFLTKPFTAEELLARVRDVLAARSPFARPGPPER
jgi:CheY-like chemotaxis protein